MNRSEHERIVITDAGLVSPLGCGVEAVWQQLIQGKSGIGSVEFSDQEEGRIRYLAGLVPDTTQSPLNGFDASQYFSARELARTNRFVQLAVGAAEQALSQAEWRNSSEHQKMRTAVIIGTGLGGVASLFDAHQALAQRGRKGVSPFSMPLALANSAAGAVSIRFGFRGPLHAPSSACAAGLQAIGEAMKVLRHGEAEMVLAGGSEAPINPVVLAGFTAAGALSTQYMATPGEASRPFDSTRDGFVLSEGAAMFALETLAHARARGVQPLAELCGFGTSGDAYHITSGARDGEGVARAMQATLDMAGVPVSEVGYLSAHATSTPVGDEREYLGIETVYGPFVSSVAVSSERRTGSHTGRCRSRGTFTAADGAENPDHSADAQYRYVELCHVDA